MHLYLESSNKSQSDCSISALSWMGKVPDDMPEEEGWKLNRVLYYQEGWLATGNARGIVGVTYTSSHSKKNSEVPSRSNYNLRGHRTEVTLVRWNEPYQKLATCDSSGIIFVWIKYEGRWSIELINDRNTPVTNFSWSHDGRMALICYQDGFVLVGSVAGQRYWSMMLTLESTITAGVFTPDDQQVYFGTTSGLMIVMDVHGATVSQDTLLDDTGINTLTWSCPKFKMEEGEDGSGKSNEVNHLLAVLFQNGLVYLMRNHDDLNPTIVRTGLQGVHAEWNNSGDLLAVGGYIPEQNCPTSGVVNGVSPCPLKNVIKFYTRNGTLRYSHYLPLSQHPITALTWGHNDKRVFIATGPILYIGRVTRRVASLQLLCRLAIKSKLSEEDSVTRLPLPKRMRSVINTLYTQTIRCCVPDANQLREFVSRPPLCNRRLHCTMIRHDEDLVPTPGACYTLYLEYLGGLVPLLKGKRTSKIRPEFVIYDPQADEDAAKENSTYRKRAGSGTNNMNNLLNNQLTNNAAISDSSDSEYEDMCASPRLQRRRKLKKRLRERLESEPDELIYLDTLPEQHRLVEVTSNIWGTKFKLHGVAPSLPSNLGQVTYKTSLLHLQPRQMTLIITELRDDIPPRQDPNFNPNVFSEDEEEPETRVARPLDLRTDVPPIAPMTPRRTPSCYSHQDLASPVPGPWDVSRLPISGKCLTDKEEHTYVDLGTPEMVRLRAELKFGSNADEETKKNNINNNANSNNVNSTKTVSVKSDSNFLPKNSSNNSRFISPESSSRATSNYLNSKNGVGGNRSPLRSSNLAPSIYNNNTNHKNNSSNNYGSAYRNNHNNIKNCNETSYVNGNVLRSDVIRYIDDESGESEDRSFTPSPSRMRPLSRSQRARSKSVGHLINVEALPPNHSPPLSHHFHQLTSIEAFLAFRRSLSLKDCKKEAVLGERLVSLQRDHSSTSAHPPPTPKHVPSPEVSRRNPNKASPSISPTHTSKSTPPTPSKGRKHRRHQSSSPIRKHLLNSPLLSRRRQRRGTVESSDDEVVHCSSDAEILCSSSNYRDLETFQKNQLKNKLRRTRGRETEGRGSSPSGTTVGNETNSYVAPRHRQFVMHNKAPLWNENSQVYQLDFGGRVTQESAKNFQIEFKGKQVMQFGRIDVNAYTLDFQYPFSAIQAFAVALANVTQRLK